MILHLPGLEVHHGEARHIRGHHVRRKLDAVEAAIQRLGQRADHGGLAGAGHVLQQHVTLAHQRDQQQFDHLVLADDDLADILFQCGNNLARIEHNNAPLFWLISGSLSVLRKAPSFIISEVPVFNKCMTKVLRL